MAQYNKYWKNTTKSFFCLCTAPPPGWNGSPHERRSGGGSQLTGSSQIVICMTQKSLYSFQNLYRDFLLCKIIQMALCSQYTKQFLPVVIIYDPFTGCICIFKHTFRAIPRKEVDFHQTWLRFHITPSICPLRTFPSTAEFSPKTPLPAHPTKIRFS